MFTLNGMSRLLKSIVMLSTIMVIASFSLGLASADVVVNAAGDPVEDALVQLVEYPQYNNTTDVFGNYTIPNVPIGTYLISASAPGYVTNTSSVTVLENEIVTMDFLLEILFNKSVFAPGQVYTPGGVGWATQFTVTNFDSVSRSILIDFAADNGAVIYSTSDTLPPLSFNRYNWSDIYTLTGVPSGSANVTSNMEVINVITEQRLANDFTVGRLGFFDAVQNNPLRTDFSVLGQLYTPGGAGWRTNFKITNIADSSANVNVAYYRDDSSLITTESFSLPASGSIIKQWQTIQTTYGVASGTARVTSDQPLIIKPSQAVDAEGGLGFWSGYAYDSSNKKVYIPELVYYNDAALTRGNFKLTNLGSGTANLKITYLYMNGTVIFSKSDSLVSGATRLYNWQTDVYNIYGATEGSAIVESDQQIAVIASIAKNTGADSDNFRGIQIDTTGTHTLAPGLKYMGNDSVNLTVSNMANSSNEVTLKFLQKDGTEITTIVDTLTGNESSRYSWKTLIYDVYGMPEGSVEINSTQPIASLLSQDLISPQGRLGYFTGEAI